MHIVGLHPEHHPEPFVQSVPFMQTEIEGMMSDQRRFATVEAIVCCDQAPLSSPCHLA